ncbi:MAG: hypothetical protein ACI9DF_006049 [Verrucomicrobiales bacterium]|jgi:hypothetical protein
MKASVLELIAALLTRCGSKPESPTVADEAAIEVFQRAFWKRPTSEDKILHAERREWTGDDGQLQWHWFLVVELSPELGR